MSSWVLITLHSYLDDNGATDPNSDTGNTGAEILLGFSPSASLHRTFPLDANGLIVNDTKTMLSNMSISLPVGNADAGSYFNDLVLEDVDYGASPPFSIISRIHQLKNSLLDG